MKWGPAGLFKYVAEYQPPPSALAAQEYARDLVVFAAGCAAKPLEPHAGVLYDRVVVPIIPIAAWFRERPWRARLAMVGVFLCYFAYLLVFTAHGATNASCSAGQPGIIDSASNELSAALTTWPDALARTLTLPFNALLGLAVIIILAIGVVQGLNGQQWGWSLFIGTIMTFGIASSFFHYVPQFGPSFTDFIVSKATLLNTGPEVAPIYSSISEISPGNAWNRFACLGDEEYTLSQLNDKFFGITHPITTLENAGADFTSQGVIYLDGALTSFELLAVKIEAPIVLAAGAILALGLAIPQLWVFPMQWIGALIGLGLKVLTLGVVSGVAFALTGKYMSTMVHNYGSNTPLTPHTAWTVALSLLLCAGAVVFLPNLMQHLGGAPGIPGGAALSAVRTAGGQVGNWAMNMAQGGFNGGGAGEGGGGGEAATEALQTASQAAETIPEVIVP